LIRELGNANWAINISPALAFEYEDVLKRDGLLPGYTAADIDRLLRSLFAVGNLIPAVPSRTPRLRDPDDERILEVAMVAGAIVVTHNVRDFSGAERFGVRVATPAAFLRELERNI
jgi:predicted nucleic acid-binding protein